jgi:uncharacterized membrane protein
MRDQPGMSETLRGNIDRLTARAAAERAAAPLSDRMAARISDFAGSMPFVLIHLAVYGAWVAVNLGWVPGVMPFDPTFVVLAMEASVEAIFLSTFVLITQNRMARDADRRADLDLHVNLLAEHELTRLARLVEAIAERLEVPIDRAALAEIKQDVAPDAVLDELEARGE